MGHSHVMGGSTAELNASEALFGFCGWLTSRDEVTIMSSRHEASGIADLIEKFCVENNLEAPRKKWADNLTHPAEEN